LRAPRECLRPSCINNCCVCPDVFSRCHPVIAPDKRLGSRLDRFVQKSVQTHTLAAVRLFTCQRAVLSQTSGITGVTTFVWPSVKVLLPTGEADVIVCLAVVNAVSRKSFFGHWIESLPCAASKRVHADTFNRLCLANALTARDHGKATTALHGFFTFRF